MPLKHGSDGSRKWAFYAYADIPFKIRYYQLQQSLQHLPCPHYMSALYTRYV